MKTLNTQQINAIKSNSPYTLVIAGAGTGKTEVLTQHIATLIKRGIQPEKILVTTFTNASANDIRQRAAKVSNLPEEQLKYIGTMHSLFLKLINEERNYQNLLPLEPIEEKKLTKIIQEVSKNLFPSTKIRPTTIEIILLQRMIHKGQALDHIPTSKEAKITWQQVENYLHKKNLILIDNINTTFHRLLENPLTKQRIGNKISHILVDEFQDTSQSQFKVLEALKEAGCHFFLIGDDYQGIYGFRDADISIMQETSNHFPGTQIHRLEINYRCPPSIVKASNQLIQHNQQLPKQVKAHKISDQRIGYLQPSNHYGEASFVKKKALEFLNETEETVAILYRNHTQSINIRHIINKDEHIKDHPRLTISTIHGSKGLEFDHVMIIGACQSIIPHKKNCLEEERRLFYVACTRAKKSLIILSPKASNYHQKIMRKEEPSQFIYEMQGKPYENSLSYLFN